jgi:hypothetical protein
MTPLPLLVLEAGSGTKFLTNSANPTLWTLFGSHKELGGTSLIPYPLIVFTFGFVVESIKELGGASIVMRITKCFHYGMVAQAFKELLLSYDVNYKAHM